MVWQMEGLGNLEWITALARWAALPPLTSDSRSAETRRSFAMNPLNSMKKLPAGRLGV